MNKLIKKVEKFQGNYFSTGCYISFENMKKLISMIPKQHISLESMLITPFLINTLSGMIYELHYYEFSIVISSAQVTHYFEYDDRNILPDEIIRNIKPKIIVSNDNVMDYFSALDNYLNAMKQMKFNEILDVVDLSNFQMFFQLY